MNQGNPRVRQVLLYFGLGREEDASGRPPRPDTLRDHIGRGLLSGVIFGLLMTLLSANTARDGLFLGVMFAVFMIVVNIAVARYEQRKQPDSPTDGP